MSQQHREIREGDEVFCTRCHKRWGIDEEAPLCISNKELRKQKNKQQINKLRRMLKR